MTIFKIYTHFIIIINSKLIVNFIFQINIFIIISFIIGLVQIKKFTFLNLLLSNPFSSYLNQFYIKKDYE